MSKCFDCKHNDQNSYSCMECMHGEMYEKKIITQADKIRSMNNEELAEFLINIKSGTDLTFGEYVHFNYTIFSNTGQIIKWLQSEVSK